MGFLSDTLDFEKHRWSGILDEYKQDPWRLLIGAGPDKASTKLWNAVLDKDWEPMTDYWGNATDDQFARAEAEGINTEPSRQGYTVADTIAKIYAGNWAGGKLGGMFGDGGGSANAGAGAEEGGRGWLDWAKTAMDFIPQDGAGASGGGGGTAAPAGDGPGLGMSGPAYSRQTNRLLDRMRAQAGGGRGYLSEIGDSVRQDERFRDQGKREARYAPARYTFR